MSRLDSFIRRMQAQRSCIDFAAQPGNLPKGSVFGFGLGNGRTYDHLRVTFRSREIFVFDRRADAHPSCVPDPAHLFLGEITETLPRVAPCFRGQVAFIHLDISSGDETLDRATTLVLAPLITEVAAPLALAASDQPLPLADWHPVSLSPKIPEHRYFLYRRSGVAAGIPVGKGKSNANADERSATLLQEGNTWNAARSIKQAPASARHS